MSLIRGLVISVGTLTVLLLWYKLTIRSKTTFKAQRIALCFILVASILLPFIPVEWLNRSFVPVLSTYWEDMDFIDNWVNGTPISDVPIDQLSFYNSIDFQPILLSLYGIGVVVFGSRFLVQLGQLLRLVLHYKTIHENKYRYVLIDSPNYAAAFMHYIIISKHIWEAEDKLPIVQHERQHVDFWHSIDRFLTEILCVFQWFNPFIYWFRKELIALHEFQVDQAMIRNGVDTIQYQQLIVQHAISSKSLAFGNHFSHSLTLNRIKMIAQNKSFPISSIYRILFLIPVTTILFTLFAFQSTIFTKAPTPNTLNIQPTNGAFILPIKKGKYKKTIGYGLRMHPIQKVKKLHKGVDFAAPLGTPILAVQNGQVLRVQHSQKGYGNNVVLQINETTQVMYAHMDSIQVKAGQLLVQGSEIGTVGSTGSSTNPHLHFEIVVESQKVDPKPFLPKY